MAVLLQCMSSVRMKRFGPRFDVSFGANDCIAFDLDSEIQYYRPSTTLHVMQFLYC